MTPRIRSGQEVELAPVSDPSTLRTGEIVLVRVGGSTYLHLIRALERDRVQIGNNHGRVNGWTSRASVYGRVVRIGPNL
ncbi:hypothetical protein [Miltoncostaea oceani]|uniref:hypothetical protein n=1 Tax=Miltoncostaea oceani TaxID=2843216 RepID=UPI0031B9EBE8